MCQTSLSPPAPDAVPKAWRAVLDSGLLRCGVPASLGGVPGGTDALAAGAAELARHSPAAGCMLWAQRLGIEALLQSPNIALRDHWLADALGGERAMTLSPLITPLQAYDTGRGWLLQGRQRDVPNLQWAGFSLVAPLWLNDAQAHWVLLRSEEDGLSIEPASDTTPCAPSGTLQLNQVFFREDEWLCGPDLPQRLRPVAEALSCALAGGTDWNPRAAPLLSPPTIPTT